MKDPDDDRPDPVDGQTTGQAPIFAEIPSESPPAEDDLGLAGRSASMVKLRWLVRRCARTLLPVLVTGEGGSGKEIVCRALHKASARADRPFVAVSAAEIAGDIAQSELFGHEKGAFTGAIRSHKGAFERAGKGTLLIDEVGDLPLHLQPVLLRAVEARAFTRVGGETPVRFEGQFVSATNRDLPAMISERRFREDLYYRLAGLKIHLPPLRDHLEDLPDICRALFREMKPQLGRHCRIEGEALGLLATHRWPGNVRELRAVLIEAAALGSGDRVTAGEIASVMGLARSGHEFYATLRDEPERLPGAVTGRKMPGPKLKLAGVDLVTILKAGGPESYAKQTGIHRSVVYRHLARLRGEG